ncbi:hypothetical protein KSP39_PZI020522 [Platanthera zijinensis]|uniref:Uncharacterized protein n=1 Tax=Platanthera zijinensis TaxID=2320716 RepID=A0AAP0FXJ3_9ASPA
MRRGRRPGQTAFNSAREPFPISTTLCFQLPALTIDDSQTWFSVALANQETCRNGFTELGSSYHFPSSPFFSQNISVVAAPSATDKVDAPHDVQDWRFSAWSRRGR